MQLFNSPSVVEHLINSNETQNHFQLSRQNHILEFNATVNAGLTTQGQEILIFIFNLLLQLPKFDLSIV